MPTYVSGTLITANALNNGEAVRRFIAIGDLNNMIGRDIDHFILPSQHIIGAIDIICPSAASSGTITIDLFTSSTSGGALASIYTTNPKPTLTCAGGVSFVTSTNLPNTIILSAGTILSARIVSAPVGCRDIYISVR